MLQGRGKLPMGRRTKADELGMTMETSANGRGRWRVIVRTDTGQVVFDKDGYVSESQAKQGAYRFLKANYEETAVISPVDELYIAPDEEPLPSAIWQQQMTEQAADMEAKAVDMRERANTLEAEAKRLRAAADILAEI